MPFMLAARMPPESPWQVSLSVTSGEQMSSSLFILYGVSSSSKLGQSWKQKETNVKPWVCLYRWHESRLFPWNAFLVWTHILNTYSSTAPRGSDRSEIGACEQTQRATKWPVNNAMVTYRDRPDEVSNKKYITKMFLIFFLPMNHLNTWAGHGHDVIDEL